MHVTKSFFSKCVPRIANVVKAYPFQKTLLAWEFPDFLVNEITVAISVAIEIARVYNLRRNYLLLKVKVFLISR